MAEIRASPVVNPSYKRIADVLAGLQGPMGQVIPFTDANPFKLLMPAAATFENLAYGNAPLAMPPGVTNRRLPIVKTGREGDFTDLASLGLLATGVPQVARGTMQGANYLGDVLTQATRTAPPAAPMRAVSEIAEAAPITPKPLPPEPVRSDIGFYSQLEAATNPLQDKGTGDQYLSQLQKTAGVKPDEIKYTGLDEFLKGKKSVTKAEIRGYLASNKVDVQEVRLGDFKNPYPHRSADEWQRAIDNEEAVGDFDEAARLTNAWEEYEGFGPAGMAKFSKYTLPGGENYREILLTLPAKKLTEAEARIILGAAPDAKLSSADIAYANRKNVDEYKSTHFDQPNVLAHMRANDRTVDGKKTLFIEEIQSDWHQKGREKGYQSKDIESQLKVMEKSTERRYRDIRQLSNEMTALDDTQLDQFNALAAERQRLLDLYNEEIDQGNRLYDARREGVPDAPFKTSWHELTLKRAIQEASEKGYDQIAFTTGKTQAERYDLSKSVSRVTVDHYRAERGEVTLKAYDLNGNSIISKQGIQASELDDYVGKDAADRARQNLNDNGKADLKGLDLKVGGEGMKGFYDQILPKSLEKLGKKFDAKVGKTQMDGVEVWQMDITPKMRESVTTKGQPLFSISGLGAGAIGSGFYQDDTAEQLRQ